MNIDVEHYKKRFDQIVNDSAKDFIESLYLFGSIARGENIQDGSDVDAVLVVKSAEDGMMPFNSLTDLGTNLQDLDKDLGVKVDYVIVTNDDLFELLSYPIIASLAADGVSVFGKNLKKDFEEYVLDTSQEKILNSLLRTTMFQRHLLRKKLLKLDTRSTSSELDSMVIAAAKEVMTIAQNYYYFINHRLITSRRDLCSYFLAEIRDADDFVNTPMTAYNVRNSLAVLSTGAAKLEFLQRAFLFVEKATTKLQIAYKTATNSTSLNLNPY